MSQLGQIKGVSVDPSQPEVAGLGPWVTLSGGAAGYLHETGAVFSDLSRDGHAEAVIPMVSGPDLVGTGALVLTPTDAAPERVGDDAFYGSFGTATRVTVESGELILRHLVGAGWEPSCCLSGEVTRRFRSDGTTMIESAAPLEIGNPAAKGFTIDRFYFLLGQKNYDAAGILLTDAEKARTAVSQWPAWWQSAAQMTVNILSTPRTDDMVPFRLVIATTDGRIAAWQGAAGLVYNPSLHSWQISLVALQPEAV
ncbi:MAG: hypothetical protein IT196_15225 [Acidimicrobiales bacterium]|nr:hypothetical protein [Acidimicrobiales bacterium]